MSVVGFVAGAIAGEFIPEEKTYYYGLTMVAGVNAHLFFGFLSKKFLKFYKI